VKYQLGEHFEIARTPQGSIITFTMLLPNLNEFQEICEYLCTEEDLELFYKSMETGWKKHKEFLDYTDNQFFKQNSRLIETRVADTKLTHEGEDRYRLTSWLDIGKTAFDKELNISNNKVAKAILDRI